MAKTMGQIIESIDAFMTRFRFTNSQWYVGIATDPEARLFNDHNVDREKGAWIYERAQSSRIARQVEQAYLKTGHDGGTGGGDDDSVFVYAFVKLDGTER